MLDEVLDRLAADPSVVAVSVLDLSEVWLWLSRVAHVKWVNLLLMKFWPLSLL